MKNSVSMMSRLPSFSSSAILKQIPQINLQDYLSNQSTANDCFEVAQAFRKFGCIMIKDPRIDQEKNVKLINTMKEYYTKRQKMLDRGEIPEDVFREHDFDIGLSPPGVVKLEDYSHKLHQFHPEHLPMTPYPPKPSRTLRYLWNIGGDGIQLENRPPSDFPLFANTLNDWGNNAFDICLTLTQMLENGLNLPHGSFSSKLLGGANKLAPNGFDLTRCEPYEPFIGLHVDYGFLTIHGKSSFPGLFVWLPNGEKLMVRVPTGYLFIQAGSQLEYLTGGYIKSGLHEVINTYETQALAKKEKEEGGQPWRINSTIFTHIHPDVLLRPLGHFSEEKGANLYPPVLQKDFMMTYLKNRQA